LGFCGGGWRFGGWGWDWVGLVGVVWGWVWGWWCGWVGGRLIGAMGDVERC